MERYVNSIDLSDGEDTATQTDESSGGFDLGGFLNNLGNTAVDTAGAILSRPPAPSQPSTPAPQPQQGSPVKIVLTPTSATPNQGKTPAPTPPAQPATGVTAIFAKIPPIAYGGVGAVGTYLFTKSILWSAIAGAGLYFASNMLKPKTV